MALCLLSKNKLGLQLQTLKNMKTKVFLLVIFAFLGKLATAQDDDKSFKFGLKAIPSINWYKPDDTKFYSSDGTNIKFSYGLITEFKLAGSAWLSTGLQVDKDGGKINYLDTVICFLNQDGEIISAEDTGSVSSYTIQKLDNRVFKASYVTLPLTLRLRTKEVGMMTYYGQFGFPISIKLRGRSEDVARKVNSTYNGFEAASTNKDLDISSDMGFMNVGLMIGGGAEYNMSGNTSILFGIHYNQGFMNTVRRDSKQLKNADKMFTSSPAFVDNDQKFYSRSVALTVGILF